MPKIYDSPEKFPLPTKPGAGGLYGIKRVHMHWSGGSNKAGPVDLEHYHYVIGGDSRVYEGKYPVKANVKLVGSAYAAHTKGANSGAIGVSAAGMNGAEWSNVFPAKVGKYPISSSQLSAMIRFVATLCFVHNIPITRKTVLTHAEVQPTLGIPQNSKWDYTWLPDAPFSAHTAYDPVLVGDYLRARIQSTYNQLLRSKGLAPVSVAEKIKPITPTQPKSASPSGQKVQSIMASNDFLNKDASGNVIAAPKPKSIFASLTLQGIVVAIAPYVLRKAGVDMDPDTITSTVDTVKTVIDQAAPILGSIMAAWGRIRASTKLKI